MAKTEYLTAFAGEFSEWQFTDPRERRWSGPPVHLQKRIICCDCGLAHDFEFAVVETAIRGDRVVTKRIAPSKYAVQWRVRRNERATSRVRKTPQVCTPKKRRK